MGTRWARLVWLAVLSLGTVGCGSGGTGRAPAGGRLYVADLDHTVPVVDAAFRRVVATIPVGHAPNGIAYWFENGGMP